VSENIRVTSIVGRFLEHARMYYFRNGGEEEELFLGSADLMPRNLDGRVEALFPIEDPRLLASIRDDILFTHLKDTEGARQLLEDGRYTPLDSLSDESLDSQALMLGARRRWHLEEWHLEE
jgi:polyphosphate kinase